jgi:hypothetical protein
LIYTEKVRTLNIVFPVFFACLCPVTAEEANSGLNPHPIGTPVTTAITFGDAYANAIEVYDAKITLIEVRRGERAWDLLKKESAANQQPLPGFEYVVARIQFEYTAKGKPGDKSYFLSEAQFIAFSSDGSTQYPTANTILPSPALARTMHSGDTSEGWAAFLVARTDRKPFMIFHEDVRLLSHAGIGPAFRLY